MKNYTLFLLVLPLFLVGWGQQKTSSNLKVSTSFAATNGSFPGGMMIIARSTDGKVFSRGIGYTGGANTLDVSLPNGSWDFTVVAWTAANITGTVCDSTTKVLNGSDATIDLNPSQVNCTQTKFGSPAHYATTDFRPLLVGGCSTLYRTASGTGTFLTTSPSDSALTWCTNSNLPQDLVGKRAKSIKVSMLNVELSGAVSDSGISTCRRASLSQVTNSATTLNITFPTKQVPVLIEFYKGDDCTSNSPKDIIGSNLFRDGIDGTYNFDFKLQTIISDPNLYLVTGKTKSGYSPFVNIFPEITCSSSTCLPTQNNYGSNARIFSQGSPFVLTTDTTKSCTSLGTVNLGGTNLSPSDYQCEDKDGPVLLSIFSNIPGTCTGGCPITFSGDGSLNLSPLYVTQYSAPHFYDKVYAIIGVSKTNLGNASVLSSNQFFGDKEDKIFGVLSEARGALIPNGPGGLFGQTISPCSTFTGTKTITLFDEDGFKNYQVEIANDGSPVPQYICTDADPNAVSCGAYSNFEKKLIARRIVAGPAYIPEQVLHFFCNKKIGMIETRQYGTNNTEDRFDRKVLSWNTELPNYARVDKISEEKTTSTGTGYVLRWETNYTRFEKNQAADSQFFTASTLGYRAELDNSQYFRESIYRNDFDMNVGFLVAHEKNVEYTNTVTNTRSLATNAMFNDQLDSTSSSPFHVSAVNTYGDKVSAWSSLNGSKFDLTLSIRYASDVVPFTVSIPAQNTLPIRPRVVFNDVSSSPLRFPVVVFESDITGTMRSYVLRFDPTGPAWKDQTNAAFSTSTYLTNTSHTASVSEVLFPSPTVPDFVVLFSSIYISQRFVDVVSYNAGTWLSSMNIMSGGSSSSPHSDLRATVGQDGKIYIAANAFDFSSQNKLDTQVCPTVYLLTQSSGPCGSGDYDNNLEVSSTKLSIFNLWANPGSGATASRTFGMNTKKLIIANTSFQSASSAVSGVNFSATMDPICFNSNSPFGSNPNSMNTVGCGAPLAQTLIPSLRSVLNPGPGYHLTPRNMEPTSSTFMDHFSSGSTFSAQ
jgi:hypothetical protein